MHSQILWHSGGSIAVLESIKCKVGYKCWHVKAEGGGIWSCWSKDWFCLVTADAVDCLEMFGKSFPTISVASTAVIFWRVTELPAATRLLTTKSGAWLEVLESATSSTVQRLHWLTPMFVDMVKLFFWIIERTNFVFYERVAKLARKKASMCQWE